MRTKKQLLELIYKKIRARTPEQPGICALMQTMFKKGVITSNENIVMQGYMKHLANSTTFVTEKQIKEANEEYYSAYIEDIELWLYAPNDWKSRRKWLKEKISQKKSDITSEKTSENGFSPYKIYP